MLEPIRLSLSMRCNAAHAWDMWTRRISMWWPRSHTMSGESDAEIILEPGIGGRIFERTAVGAEHEWGEVTLWEPPRRLCYLWHIRTDRANATEVQVTFRDGPAGICSVEIEHRGWDRLGDRGPDWRERNIGGWSGLWPHFKAACEGAGEGDLEGQADGEPRLR